MQRARTSSEQEACAPFKQAASMKGGETKRKARRTTSRENPSQRALAESMHLRDAYSIDILPDALARMNKPFVLSLSGESPRSVASPATQGSSANAHPTLSYMAGYIRQNK